MAKNETFLYGIDTEKVTSLMEDTQNNVKYFTDVYYVTSKKFTKDLDIIMEKLQKIILSPENITTNDLEKYYLELVNLLYFLGERYEELSVYDDMSKSAQKEVYNKTYLANSIEVDKKKPTVAENQAVAEQKSQYETVVNSIYNHAAKVVKYKIDAAYEMVSALKKIVSRRMQEESLSASSNRFSDSIAYPSKEAIESERRRGFYENTGFYAAE